MKKRVKVEELKLGMYVCELDRQWRDLPFATQSFALKSNDQIEQLAKYFGYVYIETDLQTPEPALVRSTSIHLYGFDHLERPELELEILKKYATPGIDNGGYADRISVEEEIDAIRETHEQAINLIEDLMHEVRHGKNINTVATREVVSELTDSIVRNPDALVCFTRMKEARSITAQHGLRCCILALAFGRHLGMGQLQLHDLGIGALLHDIGKTRVPTEILDSGHELNEEEKQVYRKHISDGVAILESTPGIPKAAIEFVRHHHEHYDGSGFMLGLIGNEISQFGHIGNIINSYDGLTSDRPGKGKVLAHTALKMMYEQRNKLFHPHMVEEFIRCMGIYPIGSIVEMRSGEVGVVIALNRSRKLKPRVAIILDPACNTVDSPVVVDLVGHRNRHGEALEIANVLDEKVYDFDPTDYLPVIA